MFIENLFDQNITCTFGRKKAYLLVINHEKQLEETLLPIKHFVYSCQRLKNLLVYRHLKSNGFKCYGIKTDSLFVNATEEQMQKIFNFNNEIGGLKIEKNKLLCNKDHFYNNCGFTSTTEKMVNIMYIKSEINFLKMLNHTIKNSLMF